MQQSGVDGFTEMLAASDSGSLAACVTTLAHWFHWVAWHSSLWEQSITIHHRFCVIAAIGLYQTIVNRPPSLNCLPLDSSLVDLLKAT